MTLLEPPEDPGGRGIFRFSPEVQLGHLLQAGVMLCALFGIYFTVIARLGDHDSKLLVHEQRLGTIDMAITRLEETQRSLATQTGQKLDSIISQLADLRVVVAGKSYDAPHR